MPATPYGTAVPTTLHGTAVPTTLHGTAVPTKCCCWFYVNIDYSEHFGDASQCLFPIALVCLFQIFFFYMVLKLRRSLFIVDHKNIM